MKLFSALLLLASPFISAQSPTPAQNPAKSHTVFSRHLDESTPEQNPSHASATPISLSPAERSALTFTAYDLDIRLTPAESTSFSAHVRATVRNDSAAPLIRLPLQLSSTLDWETIGLAGKSLPFKTQTIDSDIDHTGGLNEAVIELRQPLAPHAILDLDLFYSGSIPQSSQRLIRIDTPEDQALRADWDRISPAFIGLRGIGNVIWFPISTPPALLGDGARLFHTISEWKLRQSAAKIRLRLTSQSSGSDDASTPNLCLLNGAILPLKVTEALAAPAEAADSAPSATPAAAVSSSNSTTPDTINVATSESTPPPPVHIATCESSATPLGFASPSLFLLHRTKTTLNAPGGTSLDLYTNGDADSIRTPYAAALTQVASLFEQWFHEAQPGQVPVSVIALPDPGDTPYADRSILFQPLPGLAGTDIGSALSHALAYSRFQSPRVWLSEGVPQFLSLLQTERSAGRDQALTQLSSQNSALALAEPASPGTTVDTSSSTGTGSLAATAQSAAEDDSNNLIQTSRDVFYRDKSAYVLWMLRDLAGDSALSAALRDYRPASDTDPAYFQHLVEAAAHKDLSWFFNDWVYRDRGLPDLSIAAINQRGLVVRVPEPPGKRDPKTGVRPTPAADDGTADAKADSSGNVLVAVDVANDGYAAAEVPVTARSERNTATQRLLIPARSHATTRILLQGQPIEIIVNDGSVPEVQASQHRRQLTPE